MQNDRAVYHKPMTFAEYALALLALLISPGPTNTLLFVAGAERGPGRALPLIAVVIAAYLATVMPLALAGDALLHRWPMARSVLMLLSALWVLVLATRLWRMERPAPSLRPDAPMVTAFAVALTTLLNPKALVIGLVLLPGFGNMVPGAAVLVLIASGASLLWVVAGRVVARNAIAGRNRTADRKLTTVRRFSALWLALLATLLLVRAVTP